jgi:hypothetical protein
MKDLQFYSTFKKMEKQILLPGNQSAVIFTHVYQLKKLFKIFWKRILGLTNTVKDKIIITLVFDSILL